MIACRIVEARLQRILKRTLPLMNDTMRTISFGCAPFFSIGMLVHQLGYAFFGKKARKQNVCIR